MNARDAARGALEAVRRRYGSCAEYMDRGIVRFEGADHGTFETTFRREDVALSFHFADEIGEYLIACEHGELYEVRLPPDFPTIPELRTVDDYVAGLTGVTLLSAYVVPSLLVPDLIKGRSFVDAEAPDLVGEEQVDGAPCLMVDLGGALRGTVLSIDAGSALRRVRVASGLVSSLAFPQQEILYDPAFGPVSAATSRRA